MPYCRPKAQRGQEGGLALEEITSSSAEQEAGASLAGIEE
jgi:hypothetical protein